MKLQSLLRALIIIIIIIGGTIIIIIWRIPKPDPPPCIVCGINLANILGWGEVVLGAITLGVANRVINSGNNRMK
ncbi:MAG TPA: hypothetical protein PL045_01600 [Chitinophagaceae bacterium]|nr:hypothetical protein [Chitinophagaceae bacterium]